MAAVRLVVASALALALLACLQGSGGVIGGRATTAAAAPVDLAARPSGRAAAGDPQRRLGVLAPAPPADPATPPPSRECPDPPCFDPSHGRTPAAFFAWVGRDLHRFWRTRVVAIPFQWPGGRQIVVRRGQQARSRCERDPVTTFDGPFYCTRDRPRTVYVPAEWMRNVILRKRNWGGWRRKDFAFAYVLAHEWAHHLQDVVRILGDKRLKAIQIELQADCLAGVWAHSTWSRDLLEPGDIREAIALARRAGDRPGTPQNDPDAHGNANQRATWFRRGYDTGEARNCIVRVP